MGQEKKLSQNFFLLFFLKTEYSELWLISKLREATILLVAQQRQIRSLWYRHDTTYIRTRSSRTHLGVLLLLLLLAASTVIVV